MEGQSSGQGAARKVLVFLLEDDPAIASLVTDAVDMQGWRLVHQPHCAGSVEVVRKERPDIALLDVNLPDGDGFSVCEALRKDPAFALMPVIFITSRGDVNSRLRGFKVGAQDYVLKPFLIEELVARLRAHLAIHERQSEMSQDLMKSRLHDRVRQDIMDMVVHDLSAPLGTVKLTLDMIQMRGLITDQSANHYLKCAENSLEFAMVMIAGLLDLGAGKVRVELAELDVPALTGKLAKMFGPQFELKKAELRIDVQQGLRVRSDPSLLFRVLANLVSNAMKFTPNGSKVLVSVRAAESGLRADVTDGGPGVPAGEKQAIFNKYHRAVGAHVPGSGIGLAFCKMACDALKGRIWVEDVPPRGSRFSVQLPSLAN